MSSEGFFELIPKVPGSQRNNAFLYHDILDEGKYVGKHQFVKGNRKEYNASKNFSVAVGNLIGYETGYNAKSWQRKAWKSIMCEVNWESDPVFKGRKRCSKKIRHMLCIGVSIKVKADGRMPGCTQTGKPILDQITSTKDHFGYMIGNTEETIKAVFNRIYEMMYIRSKDYIKVLTKIRYESADFIMKAMVVYDDKTYDIFTGNPSNMFNALGIEFDKSGHVYL